MKTVSDKQLAANRRNALKSTGPRTPEGRAVSRMNAVRHGILSKQVLIRGQTLQESEKELEALHQRFYDDLQPEGPLEEMLVDQIVTAHWRLRRALTAEAGEIALRMDKAHPSRRREADPVNQWTLWRLAGDTASAMRRSTVGCSLVISRLCDLRQAVRAAGKLTEEAIAALQTGLGGKPCTLTLAVEARRSAPGGDTPEGLNAVLEWIDGEIRSWQNNLSKLFENEEFDDQSRQDAAVLPSADVLDKILRYETKLERQMFRAMAQLERVQRLRGGEAIPAPLSIEVSDGE